MAKTGFVPNHKGMAQVLNSRDAYEACDSSGAKYCGMANSAGHGSYVYDTSYGRSRVHTRVKTADRKSFFKERNTHTLAHIARRN